MVSSTLLCCLALTSATGWAGYTLQQDFMQGGNFLDQFTFWDTADPTNGFVQYLSQTDAEMSGLINQTANQITLAADSRETTTTGRKSIRITSNLSFQTGLLILDLAHMPGSICGSWPAFWTVGPDWPNQGEIDIIEGVNLNTFNAMTLHTGPGCSIDNSGGTTSDVFSGSLSTSNCDINAANQPTNAGCSIDATGSNTYGTGFNNAGGGVYAMELTSSGVAIWFFSRNQIPSDISSGSPDPTTWGMPLSAFQGDCDFSSSFTNQQIVFDTTFCGDWAGAVWSSSSCAAQSSSCENFVGQNPSAFAESFWTINSLQFFQDNGSGGGGWGTGAPSATGNPVQSTFVTATSAWGGGSPGSPSASPTGFGGPPNGHHHGGPPGGSGAPSGFTSPANTSPAASSPTAPAESSPAQVSSPVQTASAPPQNSAQQPPPAASSPSPTSTPQASPSEGSSGPEGLSSPASPSHTWQWGHGNGGGSFPQHSAGGQVEVQTVSVSQNMPASTAAASTPSPTPSPSSTAALAVEHDEGNGVYGVEYVRKMRERHLHRHKGRRGARF